MIVLQVNPRFYQQAVGSGLLNGLSTWYLLVEVLGFRDWEELPSLGSLRTRISQVQLYTSKICGMPNVTNEFIMVPKCLYRDDKLMSFVFPRRETSVEFGTLHGQGFQDQRSWWQSKRSTQPPVPVSWHTQESGIPKILDCFLWYVKAKYLGFIQNI